MWAWNSVATAVDTRHEMRREIANDGRCGEAQARQNATEYYTYVFEIVTTVKVSISRKFVYVYRWNRYFMFSNHSDVVTIRRAQILLYL